MTGTDKCELYKAIRKKIADVNGIEYASAPCSHPDGCTGTCPRCESETEYLDGMIDAIIRSGGKVIIPDIYYQLKRGADIPEAETELENERNERHQDGEKAITTTMGVFLEPGQLQGDIDPAPMMGDITDEVGWDDNDEW